MRINKDIYAFDSKWNEMKFFLNRGHYGKFLLNRTQWYFYPKLRYAGTFPAHVDIEITDACQLKCPMCFRHKEKMKIGYMDFELYKKIIDECKKNNVYSIKLSWRGEVLLHPKIVEMVKYAKERGIKDVGFLTNGGLLDKKLSEQLIDAKLDWISISFDGLGEKYESIRYPLKYEETLGKIRDLRKIMDEKRLKKPLIRVQTILSAVKDNPKEFYDVFKGIADKVLFIPDRDHYRKVDHDPEFICAKPWQRIIITWDGNFAQCVSDTFEKNVLGNIKDMSIKEFWKSRAMQSIRHLHKTKQRLKLSPCLDCTDGRKMQRADVKVGAKKIKTVV